MAERGRGLDRGRAGDASDNVRPWIHAGGAGVASAGGEARIVHVLPRDIVAIAGVGAQRLVDGVRVREAEDVPDLVDNFEEASK